MRHGSYEFQVGLRDAQSSEFCPFAAARLRISAGVGCGAAGRLPETTYRNLRPGCARGYHASRYNKEEQPPAADALVVPNADMRAG